jgi:hypothetical protein
MRSEDGGEDGVVRQAARLVRAARALEGAYAGPLAPVRTDQLSRMLERAGCHVEIFPFASTTVAMTLPRCAGVYPIFVNRATERTDRVFALRHELAHVLAGDVDGAVFLADEGYMAPAERAADLFALADLVPAWWLRWVEDGAAPGEAESEVAQAVFEFAEGWPADRAADRASLRLRLFRDLRV